MTDGVDKAAVLAYLRRRRADLERALLRALAKVEGLKAGLAAH